MDGSVVVAVEALGAHNLLKFLVRWTIRVSLCLDYEYLCDCLIDLNLMIPT